jgi:hypothetical protein
MPARPLRTPLVLLLLAALLILPWPAGALPGPDGTARRVPETSPGAWQLLSQAWSLLVSLWEEEGCGIDPSGHCASTPTVAPTEEGCGIDPDGRCATAATPPAPVDAGCIIDPDGCR